MPGFLGWPGAVCGGPGGPTVRIRSVTTVVEDHLSQIAEQGYAVLEGVIEPDLVDELSADLE